MMVSGTYHTSSNTFYQRKCFVFVIFVCLSVTYLIYLLFTLYWKVVNVYIFKEVTLTLVNNSKIKFQGKGHWERKCKNRFVAYLRQTKTEMITELSFPITTAVLAILF